MPKERYILVEGKRNAADNGIAVSDPWNPSANPARYAGWVLRDEPAKDPDCVMDHYVEAKQVFRDHADLRKAIKNGLLTKHGETIARTPDEARAKLLPPAPAPVVKKPSASGHNGGDK